MQALDQVIIVCISVVLVGVVALAIVILTRKSVPQLDVERYRLKWLAIEKQLTTDDASASQMVVVNADKLLDQALKDCGVSGETMGERMKAAANRWSNANNVWKAHKLRNQIAHEPDVKVTRNDARRALAGFKQALKDLGAI